MLLIKGLSVMWETHTEYPSPRTSKMFQASKGSLVSLRRWVTFRLDLPAVSGRHHFLNREPNSCHHVAHFATKWKHKVFKKLDIIHY